MDDIFKIIKEKDINFNEISEEDLVNEIDNFYLNPFYLQLDALRNSTNQSFLDIVNKGNSETIHSNFLKWFLENKSFIKGSTSPLKNLLLIALRNRDTELDQIVCKSDKSLEELLLRLRTNQIKSVSQIKIEREATFSLKKDPSGRNKRSVDLMIDFNIDDYRIRIIIENKIYTFEHDRQCEAYENFFVNHSKDPVDFVFFIFLAPYRVAPNSLSSSKFISIDYQSILEFIIEPILKSAYHYDSYSISHLKQYYHTLTSMENNEPIAASQEYRELLKQFFDENKDLILTAMKYSGDTATAEVADTYKANDAAQKKTFTITFTDGELTTTKTAGTSADLFYEVIRHIAESGQWEAQELVDKFATIGQIYASKNLISLTPPTDKNGLPNNRHLTAVKKRKQIYCTKDGDKEKIYVSNQFAFNPEKKMDNTTPFIDFINKNKNIFGMNIEVNNI